MIRYGITFGNIFRAAGIVYQNPKTRKAFEEVAAHYKLLSVAHTEPEVPNPFF
jgi:hypothetical protein